MQKKKIIFAGLLSLSAITLYKYDYNYEENYIICSESDDAFASYKNGLVYISDKDYIESLTDINKNDILIIDGRDSKKTLLKLYHHPILGYVFTYEG